MPFSLQTDETLGLLSITATGSIEGTDLLHLHSDLASQDSRPERCVIDFSTADVSQLVGPIVRSLAELPPRFDRLAIVAQPGTGYGLGRMYQASAPRRAIGVFTTRENALAWLFKRANPPAVP